MSCCQKQSVLYIVITNLLFFTCGCILLAFGVMSTQLKISDSILYPVNILKMLTILGLILIFTSLIGILGGYYRNRKMIHILYLILVLITLIYQISVAVIIFDEANHVSKWLSDTWNHASNDYRLYAQMKFNCCGFSHPLDHFIASSMCIPHQKVLNSSLQSCHRPLTQFIQSKLSWMYIALFVGLSIELLALTNSITHFCTHSSAEVSPSKETSEYHYNESSKDMSIPIVRQF